MFGDVGEASRSVARRCSATAAEIAESTGPPKVTFGRRPTTGTSSSIRSMTPRRRPSWWTANFEVEDGGAELAIVSSSPHGSLDATTTSGRLERRAVPWSESPTAKRRLDDRVVKVAGNASRSSEDGDLLDPRVETSVLEGDTAATANAETRASSSSSIRHRRACW